MSLSNLIPFGRNNGSQAPTPSNDVGHPFLSLHREINRLFDDAFQGLGSNLPSLGSPLLRGGMPRIEVSDDEKEIKVTAEMPGIDEKDVEILLKDGVLTLKGEKRSDTEDKEKQFSERYYGRFERRIPLGYDVQEDNVEARFKDGVLTITLPKTEEARAQVKRIAIAS